MEVYIEMINEYLRRVDSNLSRSYIRQAWYPIRDHWDEIVENFSDIYIFNETAYHVEDRIVRKGRNNSAKKSIPHITTIPAIQNEDSIIFEKGVDPLSLRTKGNKCYIIRLLNHSNNIVFEKVGKTDRAPISRFLEILKEQAKNGIVKIQVRQIYDVGNLISSGLEDSIRSFYIKKNPSAFVPNDRFSEKVFNLNTTNRLYREYISPAIEEEEEEEE